jgi:hypothetical protein
MNTKVKFCQEFVKELCRIRNQLKNRILIRVRIDHSGFKTLLKKIRYSEVHIEKNICYAKLPSSFIFFYLLIAVGYYYCEL